MNNSDFSTPVLPLRRNVMKASSAPLSGPYILCQDDTLHVCTALMSLLVDRRTVDTFASVKPVSASTQHQTAVAIVGYDEPLTVLTEYPKPRITHPHEVIIKNRSIGINPVDWKCHQFRFGIYHFPWINGREGSGIVEEAGDEVREFEKGSKVFIVSTMYRDNRTSTFQEYVAMDSRLVWKLPEDIGFSQGAGIGVGLATAAVILLDSFNLSLAENSQHGKTLLIWGGATVVGLYLTQLAKYLGFKVIGIASSQSHAYLEELGAHSLIDRKLPLEKIMDRVLRATTHVEFGVDCASKESTEKLVQILSAVNGRNLKAKYASIVSSHEPPSDGVEKREVRIKRFHEDIDFGHQIVRETSNLFETGKIKAVRTKVFRGGMRSVIDALDLLKNKGAQAERYIVELDN
ncbi:hypothetical protein KL941_004243 [Ogataea angusta]|nr:hypothetical protein KL941_004243 [Ogataea angusta]